MKLLQQAQEIIDGSDRSQTALSQLQRLKAEANGEEQNQIGWLIEAFLVDGGIAADLS